MSAAAATKRTPETSAQWREIVAELEREVDAARSRVAKAERKRDALALPARLGSGPKGDIQRARTALVAARMDAEESDAALAQARGELETAEKAEAAAELEGAQVALSTMIRRRLALAARFDELVEELQPVVRKLLDGQGSLHAGMAAAGLEKIAPTRGRIEPRAFGALCAKLGPLFRDLPLAHRDYAAPLAEIERSLLGAYVRDDDEEATA